MKPTPTYEVFVGESLPDFGLFYRENGVLVPGLTSGHTFELTVADLLDNDDVLFTKTSGIVGQAGSGFPPLGVPNLLIQWLATGELDTLTPGTTYRAQLAITSGGKVRRVEWLIAARAAL